MKKKNEGLARTNEMRQKGWKRAEFWARLELKIVLRRIYKWNRKNPDDTGFRTIVNYKPTVAKLKALGYIVVFSHTSHEDNWYEIDWTLD